MKKNVLQNAIEKTSQEKTFCLKSKPARPSVTFHLLCDVGACSCLNSSDNKHAGSCSR